MFLVQSAVTCGALFWLLYRAWLTLWKPVPELISILGVEVPDPPAVQLADIKADAVTLSWSPPAPHKPVLRYLIQVNGVNIGESSRSEFRIHVTGLKPGHFYNVNVIAVGTNNFQSGSSVIRLRTYRRDGRPHLANGRVLSNLSPEDQQKGALTESSDDSAAVQTAGIEPAAPEVAPAMARDLSSTHSGQRRNTGTRKHSPSIAASEQGSAVASFTDQSGETMQQLTEKFKAIQKEMDEIGAQIKRDREESNLQIDEATKEKDEKRQRLERREKDSKELRQEVIKSEGLNRSAQNRKTQREKALQEKQAEQSKMRDDMARWIKEIENMKAERASWEGQKETILAEKEAKKLEYQSTIKDEDALFKKLEDEMRQKRTQLKELEEERKQLPGVEDEEGKMVREADQQSSREWEHRYEQMSSQLQDRQIHLRELQKTMHEQQSYYTSLQRQSANALMYHGNSSGVDFDPANSQNKAKSRRNRQRKSRTNTISSPSYPEPQFASAYNNAASPSYAAGPYFDLSANDMAMVPLSAQMSGMSDADVRALTGEAPLSPTNPTATALLPSDIFSDLDDDLPPPRSPQSESGSFGPPLHPTYDNDPQSPESSSRSASLISSPRSSSQNLALYGVSSGEHDNDRRSLHSPRGKFGTVGASERSSRPSTSKGSFGAMKDMFSRSRGKTMQSGGPPLGSLKQGQSQSFPRSTEEPESPIVRVRRTSMSNWNMPNMPSFLTRGSTGDTTEGNAPAPARFSTGPRRRPFNIFGSGFDDPSSSLHERNPSSPRPLSITSLNSLPSQELPRPSSENAKLFGWTLGAEPNRASPLGPWSANPPGPTWSRNPSRRPSIQHASNSGLVSDDDEILDPDPILQGQTSPTPVGVIGTRPSSSRKSNTPKLNPAAPTFSTKLFSFGFNAKGKGKEKVTDGVAPDEMAPTSSASSPTEPRKSRDTHSRDAHSIHTQTSMAESQESLARTTSSNTPSEPVQPSKDGWTRSLLRKGSSSKFSLTSMRKESGFFGSKKDRTEGSVDEYGEDDLSRSANSVTSSPMLGSGEWKGKGKDTGMPKEGKNYFSRFSMKKGKGRESLDVDRSEAETTGTEDEG
ncbi:hypothetical protein B0O99DRAFT_508029 [Bisporella sp. PMI_857]|nr:hypothetical protein B0O99DRAFT_508029 [Bisporella sp. PMI_857]